MSRGFYTLTSGMLTQQKKIEIMSNNITNFNTAGYRKQQAVTTTFGSILINKLQQDGIFQNATELSSQTFVRVADDNDILFSQGTFDQTGYPLDFALKGNGFFALKNPDTDEISYTRNGSFSVDSEGYLVQGNNGRVQGEFGDIFLGTDKVIANDNGKLTVDGEELDKISVYDFDDYTNIDLSGEGLFTSTDIATEIDNPTMLNGVIERSNVDLTTEMTDYMESERILQTAAQAIKLYDQVATSAASSIGNV